jgi:hypothetical protein
MYFNKYDRQYGKVEYVNSDYLLDHMFLSPTLSCIAILWMYIYCVMMLKTRQIQIQWLHISLSFLILFISKLFVE